MLVSLVSYPKQVLAKLTGTNRLSIIPYLVFSGELSNSLRKEIKFSALTIASAKGSHD